MDILQDDKYWKHELNIQSRGSKSQNIIKFQELVMYIYNNLNTNNYIIDDPLDFSVEDNSYSSSGKIYNANVPSLLDSDEESDSHEEDFIIKPFLLLEEGIKAHNEEKYDNAWECLVAQSEIENLKAKYWKTYCYLYNGINVSKNLDEAIKII
ncbi:10317_t:CDS:2 [Rhizophagus irregularis]|nr:10317_t:CDS:2 [Rhizophagus irregularis]